MLFLVEFDSKLVTFKITFIKCLHAKCYARHLDTDNKKVIFLVRDFPGGAVVKNPPANAGDMGSIAGPGRSHMPRSN